MKVRYRLINNEKQVLFCNLNADEIIELEIINKSAMLINRRATVLRCGVISTIHGSVYAVTADTNYVKSAKKFTSTIESIANTLQVFEVISKEYRDKVNINTSRLLHNLTSLNAHNIQEIYSLVSQEVLSKSSAGQQVGIVEEIIKKDSRDTAFVLLRIAKNNAAMKAEFSVFNKLFDTNPRLEKKSHNVHKVLMNVLYLFFPDFTDKSVKVTIECPENTLAYFDYESIHVAFYHLIENAVKYVKPHTDLKINIFTADNFVTMLFTMVSLRIDTSEVKNIFNEGFSGEIAKKTGKSGSGIGMTRARNILEINGANISVTTDSSTLHEFFGVPFQKNIFKIDLSIKRKS